MGIDQKKILKAAEALVKTNLGADGTGHDYFHVLRVVALAKKIAEKTGSIDGFVLELACWLHDIDDRKIVYTAAHMTVAEFLALNAVPEAVAAHVKDIIDNLSYSSSIKGKKEKTLEGQIAQDADRLDAIGAIGIARAFAYGGSKGRLLYDEARSDMTTVGHFHDKLFKLEALMNTEAGKALAKERTAFMKKYLDEFEKEIKFAVIN